MESSKSTSKLSILAMFDDMCRFSYSMASSPAHDSRLLNLIQNYEQNRIQMLQYKNEIAAKDKIIGNLRTENRELNVRLHSIRLAFTREVNAKESITKDYKQLRSKLAVIQDLLNDEQRNNIASKSVLSVLSDINQSIRQGGGGRPSQSDNPNLNISNDSLDNDLLFDKSDDNLDDDENRTIEYKIRKVEPTYSTVQKSKSNLLNNNNNTIVKSVTTIEPSPTKKCCSTIDEEEEVPDDVSDLNVGFISQKDNENNQNNVTTIPKQLTENDLKMESNQNKIQYPILSQKFHANVMSTNDGQRSAKLVRHHSSNITKLNLLRSASRLEPERLTTREHNFQQKKAFRPMICTPCGKSIGFCSNFLVCVECRGVAHPRCKKELPKPCLPFVTGPGLRKMTSATSANGVFSANQGHMLMIGDFAPLNTRPCVPALLIHCCNEIDRRIEMALKDPKVKSNGVDSSPVVGVYRMCGVDREVRELRTKILESKNGIPNLTNIADIHVLCGCVKLFLRDLDDPLVTRILWNDFCRAADHVEKNASEDMDENVIDSDYDSRGEELDSSNDEWYESIQVLKEVILQLPNANRDSMAFLFLHFRHLIDSQAVTKMNARSLAKIFAPTIIGSSVPRTSMSSFVNDNIKQVTIMAALFRISRNFWHGLLNDPNFCPFKELSQNGDQSQSHQQQTKRKSLTFAKNKSSTSLINLLNHNNNNENKSTKTSPNSKHGNNDNHNRHITNNNNNNKQNQNNPKQYRRNFNEIY